MDTIINVCRDGRVVDLDVEFPTVQGRELLDSDNPLKMMAALEAKSAAENTEEFEPQPA